MQPALAEFGSCIRPSTKKARANAADLRLESATPLRLPSSTCGAFGPSRPLHCFAICAMLHDALLQPSPESLLRVAKSGAERRLLGGRPRGPPTYEAQHVFLGDAPQLLDSCKYRKEMHSPPT